jgi:thiamine phosphate synthase YjbQ (UPF0047 family)
MHITASVFINDDESGVHEDFQDALKGSRPIYLRINTNIIEQEKIMQMLI